MSLRSWRCRINLWVAVLCLCVLSGAASSATAQTLATAPAAGTPSQSRNGGADVRTRFVIGLERSVEFQVFSLTNPNRVIVDLPDVRFHLPPATDGPVGLIKTFRGGLSAPGKSRVVIEVMQPVVVEQANLETVKGSGLHLVLDIIPVETGAALSDQARKSLEAATPSALGAAGLQPPLPRPAEHPDARAAKVYKPLIVIDPGHGGHDSGAMKHGTVEKDVVLAFSRVLRDKLNATGRYKILMTRENDEFIALEERRAFAEKNKAALFIAVHADYARSHARGATIYSLRESVADKLRHSSKDSQIASILSEKEVSQVKKAGTDADVILRWLADLARPLLEVNKERTGLITRSVIEYMGSSTNMRESPDRSAAFTVLKTAQMPAVLIELAYVSNAEDAKLLNSDDWRRNVAGSIQTAIDNYFSHHMARLPM